MIVSLVVINFKTQCHIQTDVCFRRMYVHLFQLQNKDYYASNSALNDGVATIVFAFELSAIVARSF